MQLKNIVTHAYSGVLGLVAGTMFSFTIAGALYLGIFGIDSHSYESKQMEEGVQITQGHVHRGLFSESKYYEQFIDYGNDRRLDLYMDSRDLRRLEDGSWYRAIIYVSPYIEDIAETLRFGESDAMPDLIIRDRTVPIDSIERGIAVFVMTEDEYRHLDRKFLKALIESLD